MKVKITVVPPGAAPLSIRQQWVGVELPLDAVLEPGVLRAVDGGKPDPRSFGGFPVKTADAIAALREAGCAEAAEWWQEWYDENPFGHTLVFAPTCGELVTEAGGSTVEHSSGGGMMG